MPASRDSEASVFRTVKDGLTRWLNRAREVVMTPWRQYQAVPDPVAIQSTAPLWQAQVDRILKALTPAQIEGWAAAHLPGDFDPSDPYIQANLALTYNLLVRIPDEVHSLVVAAILQGTNNGESIEQIARRVDDILIFTGSENWENRARVIAQTECLPGDSTVETGIITHAYRRWYEGDLITVLSEDGVDFSGTPNHPVLTARGWIALGELMEGDYLIRNCFGVQSAMSTTDPHIGTPPATIAEVFDSIAAVGVIERIAGGEPDFHGDGRNRDVDVATAYRPLRLGHLEALMPEGLVQLILKGALLRLADEVGDSSLLTSSSEVPGFNGLTVCPCAHASCPKPASDGGSTNSQFLSQGCSCHPADVLFFEGDKIYSFKDRLRLGAAVACRLVQGSPGDTRETEGPVDDALGTIQCRRNGDGGYSQAILLDRVIKISVTKNWAHYVYNLTTVNGYFVSNGLYTKNCNRHFNGSMLAHGLLQEKNGALGLSKRWDTILDGKERVEHQQANNQVQPLNQPFIVGGESLLFPGDPTGAPSNVINCRCSLRLEKAGR